jgi:hypothetical protein
MCHHNKTIKATMEGRTGLDWDYVPANWSRCCVQPIRTFVITSMALCANDVTGWCHLKQSTGSSPYQSQFFLSYSIPKDRIRRLSSQFDKELYRLTPWRLKRSNRPLAAVRAERAVPVVSQLSYSGDSFHHGCEHRGSPFAAQQATCSCGKKSALYCNCEKAKEENAVSGARCSCRARPAGECTCDRAATENAKPAGSLCSCGKRGAGTSLILFASRAG